jgi:hypothetical protein
MIGSIMDEVLPRQSFVNHNAMAGRQKASPMAVSGYELALMRVFLPEHDPFGKPGRALR